MKISRQVIHDAMQLSEFDQWIPDFDAKHLDRPRRRPDELPGEGRKGAVLILAYPDGDSIEIALTKRTQKLKHHAGQISLPGGRQEPGEALTVTALRETHEELGVSATNIEVLGHLNQVYIPPSDFTVFPIVGWLSTAPDFRPSDDEVAEIITVTIQYLMEPATLTRGTIEIGSQQLDVPFYKVQEHRVWGATAIILREFLLRIESVLGKIAES